MENKYGIVGVAHVGLPTNDLQKTVGPMSRFSTS